MRLPYVLALVIGLCAPLSAQFEVTPSHSSAEYRDMANSEAMFEASRLLLLGENGRSALLARLNSTDPEVARATIIVLARSGESRYLANVLSYLDHKDGRMALAAGPAVTNQPAASWPILVRMARAGSVGATRQIGRYTSPPQPILEELFSHRLPEVRMAAMHWLGRDYFFRALEDPDWNVCRAAVRRLIWDRSIREQLLFHRIDRVRAFGAELAQTWTMDDLSLWARVARDRNPVVRKWAMYHLAPVMMNWREPERANREAAIEAVAAGIENGPAAVRTAAVHAVRSWALGWEEVRSQWPPDTVARVRQVFASRKLRDELVRQSRTDDYLNMGVQSMGIHMTHALVCLAMTGDDRAHDLILAKLDQEEDVFARRPLVVALKDCGQRGIETLHRMLDEARDEGRSPFNVLIAMAKSGDKRSEARLRQMATDKSEPEDLRKGVVDVIGRSMQGEYFDTILIVAKDASESRFLRIIAITSLAYCPQAEALVALEGLTQDPVESIARYAKFSIDTWKENKQRRGG